MPQPLKSRPVDLLSTLVLIGVIGSILYIVIPRPPKSYTTLRPGTDSLAFAIDTLAIIDGDTVFTQADTIINR